MRTKFGSATAKPDDEEKGEQNAMPITYHRVNLDPHRVALEEHPTLIRANQALAERGLTSRAIFELRPARSRRNSVLAFQVRGAVLHYTLGYFLAKGKTIEEKAERGEFNPAHLITHL